MLFEKKDGVKCIRKKRKLKKDFIKRNIERVADTEDEPVTEDYTEYRSR